jgi:hypothetical protein
MQTAKWEESLGSAGNILYPPLSTFLTQVFQLLECKLPNFGEQNWTSCNREFAGFSPVGEGLSDFMYYDVQGHLARFLNMKGRGKVFYLEVKSTTTESRSFHMSPNQIAFVYPSTCKG